jgi:hypothetical protein
VSQLARFEDFSTLKLKLPFFRSMTQRRSVISDVSKERNYFIFKIRGVHGDRTFMYHLILEDESNTFFLTGGQQALTQGLSVTSRETRQTRINIYSKSVKYKSFIIYITHVKTSWNTLTVLNQSINKEIHYCDEARRSYVNMQGHTDRKDHTIPDVTPFPFQIYRLCLIL